MKKPNSWTHYFIEVSGHNLESSQIVSVWITWTIEKEVWFSIRFSSCLLYRHCKRLHEFEKIEISRQSCRGDFQDLCLDFAQEFGLGSQYICCTCRSTSDFSIPVGYLMHWDRPAKREDVAHFEISIKQLNITKLNWWKPSYALYDCWRNFYQILDVSFI